VPIISVCVAFCVVCAQFVCYNCTYLFRACVLIIFTVCLSVNLCCTDVLYDYVASVYFGHFDLKWRTLKKRNLFQKPFEN
jgi:hypothetical protein